MSKYSIICVLYSPRIRQRHPLFTFMIIKHTFTNGKPLSLSRSSRRNQFLIPCVLAQLISIICFSFDLLSCINKPTDHSPTPPFCKAIRHWICYGKQTPLPGRYHSYIHFLVCCVLLSFLFLNFWTSKYPFQQHKEMGFVIFQPS